jgi:hypothetical protein
MLKGETQIPSPFGLGVGGAVHATKECSGQACTARIIGFASVRLEPRPQLCNARLKQCVFYHSRGVRFGCSSGSVDEDFVFFV